MERIWEKDYGPFRAFGYVAPEEIDVGEIFDDHAFDSPNVDEIRTDINNGDKVWVWAQVKVYSINHLQICDVFFQWFL